jgi:hypothetical protein
MDKKLRIRSTDTVLYVCGIMQVAEWTDRCVCVCDYERTEEFTVLRFLGTGTSENKTSRMNGTGTG